MDVTLAGFIALGALVTGLFAWLRQDIGDLRKNMDSKIGELSERVARIDGLLKALFMRRDLTPFPEPPPSGDRPGNPRAA